jgi:hypothetical protein
MVTLLTELLTLSNDRLISQLEAIFIIYIAITFDFMYFDFFLFFFRARQLMPRMHLSLRLIVQP